MKKSNQLLAKTCSICGLQKPLSAFLEMTSGSGTTYGNVCVSCRKIAANQPKEEAEESTRSTSGRRIDSNTLLQDEFLKKELTKKLTADSQLDRISKDQKQVKQQLKKDNIAQGEKNHRKNYLEKRFFSSSSASAPDTKKALAAQQTLIADRNEQTNNQQEAVIKNEKERVDIDVTNTRSPHEIKRHSSVFTQFAALLGDDSPLKKSMAAKQNKKQSPSHVKTTGETASDYKEKTNEFIKKKFTGR